MRRAALSLGDDGCDDVKQQKRPVWTAAGQIGHEAVEAEDVEHAGEVVAERHQAPFAAHLVEAADEEVAVTSPAFEGAEGVFGEFGPAAHPSVGVLHPRAMSFQHRFMLPAVDGARRRLDGDTARAQRAGVAIGLAADIPDLDPVAVGLAAIRRAQEPAGGTAIDICFGVVGERFMADAILRFEPRGPLGLRNVGNDPILLAGLERVAVIVAGVGEGCQRLDAKFVLRSFGHVVKLAGIVAVVDDLARRDQLVFIVDGDLNVVACHHLTVLRQQPGIRIGSRQLRLATLFQPRQIGLHGCALGHQCRNLLCDVPAAVAPATLPPCGRTLRLRAIVGLKHGAIGFNLLLDLRQSLGDPALRLDARLAGVAIKKRPVDRHNLTAHQVEFARHKHKLPVRRLERPPIVLAELGNGAIAGHQPLHQPDQFKIAASLALKTARRADPVDVAIKIELQQIRRIVRRLPSPAIRTGMAEAKSLKVQRSDKRLDRTNRIVLIHIIFHARRKKARLIPAYPGLEATIRHAESYTPLPNRRGFLPSLSALPVFTDSLWLRPGSRFACPGRQRILRDHQPLTTPTTGGPSGVRHSFP